MVVNEVMDVLVVLIMLNPYQKRVRFDHQNPNFEEHEVKQARTIKRITLVYLRFDHKEPKSDPCLEVNKDKTDYCED